MRFHPSRVVVVGLLLALVALERWGEAWAGGAPPRLTAADTTPPPRVLWEGVAVPLEEVQRRAAIEEAKRLEDQLRAAELWAAELWEVWQREVQRTGVLISARQAGRGKRQVPEATEEAGRMEQGKPRAAIDFKKKIFRRGVDMPPHIGKMPTKETSLPWCLWRTLPMCSVRFTLTSYARKAVERHLKTAQQQGRLRQVKSCLAILAIGDGKSFAEVAVVLRIHEQTVATWVCGFCCDGRNGAPRPKPTGRPPKLTPTQKAELTTLLDEGPLQAGFSSACWRSPLMQQLICDRFGVFYNVFYLAQVLKNLGLSYQKAACVAAHLDEGKRHAWCTTTWPLIWRLAHERQALLLCGDEASCPQWGTLSSTWARRGHQPMVKTSGKRKGDKVFGVIAYFTGRFWYQGQEGRLNSEAYSAFLTRVLAQVTQPIILLHDGARYHPSVAMQRFLAVPSERLMVFQLPSYSPDYHPIEKLWKKVKKEGTHLQYFPTFQALTDKVEQALLKFANTPTEILSLCSLPTELAQAA